MRQRTLGHSELQVSEMGLGCMGMSVAYGERDNESSAATILRAKEIGVNFLDSADAYGFGHNEELIGEVIKDIARRGGLTVVMSLHQLDVAKKYADRIIALAQGRVTFDGPPGDLSDRSTSKPPG